MAKIIDRRELFLLLLLFPKALEKILFRILCLFVHTESQAPRSYFFVREHTEFSICLDWEDTIRSLHSLSFNLFVLSCQDHFALWALGIIFSFVLTV